LARGGELVGTFFWRLRGNFPCHCHEMAKNQGGPWGKKMTKVTYICRSAKKKSSYLFFLVIFFGSFIDFVKGVFWAFRNKGVREFKNTKKTFFRFRKNEKVVFFGLITKNAFFFQSVFFFFIPGLFCSICFIAFLGVS
jgi:hypothetical protein